MSRNRKITISRELISKAYGPFAEFSESRRIISRPRSSDWANQDLACTKPDNSTLFFPERGSTAKAERAKALCRICPLFYVCGENELIDLSPIGVRAAMAPNDREKLRRSIGTPKLNSLGSQTVGSTTREAFFDVTKVVLGAVVLQEIDLPEALQAIHDLDIPNRLSVKTTL